MRSDDKGAMPSVAFDPLTNLGVELHQGGWGLSQLWDRNFTVN